MALSEVPLSSDWEFKFDLTAAATRTGYAAPASGLSGVQAWFSATEGGADIGGTTVNLTERIDNAGSYYGVLDKVLVAAALTSYLNATVWEVFSAPNDVLAARKVLVRAVQAIE